MTDKSMPPTPQNTLDPTMLDARQQVGEAANARADESVFMDYVNRKSNNTLKAHRHDLEHFVNHLRDLPGWDAVDAAALMNNPASWNGFTYGLLTLYRDGMVSEGLAISTVNRRLSTVKTYVKLAAKAGIIPVDEYAKIRLVNGYARKEAKRLNEKRDAAGTPTRIGDKKADHTHIAPDQAEALKDQPDTPQGRRDAVMMALLLDLGLRVGELALLKVENIDLKRGELKFHRPKVDKTQTHELSKDAREALRRYQQAGDMPLLADAPLLRSSVKGGKLGKVGMSERAISRRVNVLGKQVGIEGKLSAHDCRHYWATDAARRGIDPFRLQEAGGWNSLVMPRRYVEAAKIANEGMVD